RAAAPGCSPRTRPSTRSSLSMSRFSARSWGCSASCEPAHATPPDARTGAPRRLARGVARVPGLRRVRAPRGLARALPRVLDAPARADRTRRDRGTIRVAGRVTAASLETLRKVRTPQGRTLPTSFNDTREAAKADGKWHRKQTAGRESRESRPVRVKRWGKSPPAALATGPA